jgi:hypothetical protein
VSLKLLRKLQLAYDNNIWTDHLDLLIWLLFMGGAFLPIGSTRSKYIALLNHRYTPEFGELSWPEALKVLKQFIWSEKAFTAQGKAFWEDSFLQNGSI